MPHSIALSRLARNLIQLHLTGEQADVTPQNLGAYSNLASAGLKVSTNGESSFTVTAEALARRREFVPHSDGLSGAALGMLKRLLAGEEIEVSDETRSRYRELAMAGIMVAGHTFAKGVESVCKFTEEGWKRRHEWLNTLASPVQRIGVPAEIHRLRLSAPLAPETL